MSEKYRPEFSFIYNVQTAIDLIQQRTDITPIRFFTVLFPLWSIEVEGKQKESGTYHLIEKYVERGIQEGGLHSTRELADFFGLDHTLVARVVAFLRAIGHLAGTEDLLELTELGRASREDMQRYVLLNTHRVLYFDGFLLRPLQQEHYESRSMRFLSEQEEAQLPERYKGNKFLRLYSRGWNSEALEKLNRIPDKAKYNVPDEVTDLRQHAVSKASIPMYIFETRKGAQQSSPHYLTYTNVQGMVDPFFEEIVNTSSDILQPLYVEEGKSPQALWSEYAANHHLPTQRLIQLDNGAWQLNLLPDDLRTPDTQKVIYTLGSHWTDHGYFLHLWCEDIEVRYDAALDQALKFVAQKKYTATNQEVDKKLLSLRKALRIPIPTRDDLLKRARETDKKRAIETLERLSR